MGYLGVPLKIFRHNVKVYIHSVNSHHPGCTQPCSLLFPKILLKGTHGWAAVETWVYQTASTRMTPCLLHFKVVYLVMHFNTDTVSCFKEHPWQSVLRNTHGRAQCKVACCQCFMVQCAWCHCHWFEQSGGYIWLCFVAILYVVYVTFITCEST